ncbi:HPr family phosphocarrier protein [Salipaludibacillus sp. CUR1]|jgi:catabolite repression HPr-like protein|uniref:Catabolite repression HPr-like protein n=1 Tax=Salipaludibacillus aurantiacus TaxID=1601833 RepID=A0A1H9X7A8_9BACI|nr:MULTISPECIES: HPr family phosphocarrier protein [Salipaludibacillus]MCE7793110.1 HPr family phosphocarrier protein [Salipaludibacillus sp. CUR1]SES41757.1 catabolite repression HPr-like protein [Salipaludibacillus aurantiacus]
MIEKTITVKRKTGLQARPAALFVQEANRFSSEIFIEKDGKNVNAKSIMGIMSLAVGANKDIHLKVDGPDEQAAMEALVDFVGQEE